MYLFIIFLQSDYVIMAIPCPLQTKILYEPALPSLRNQLIQRTEMGSVIKVMLFYERAFWREKDMCGSALILDKDSPINICLDDCKPDGSYPCIMGSVFFTSTIINDENYI